MQITLPLADVLCVYGLPDHELYIVLKEWLEEHQERFLVILEDNEEILKRASQHERMFLCPVSDEGEMKKILWQLVFLHFEYLELPGNSSKDPKKMENIFSHFAFFQEGIHLTASDFQNRGINLLHNTLQNYRCFSKVRKGSGLFGKFSNTPAIICGAGPSLEKEIPYLQKLKDKALIFAGGTALSSLSQFGIEPHFGGLIDPHPPPKRFFQNTAVHMPTFFQSRVHPHQLNQMRGPLLWMPGGGNDLLEEEKFDGGWNVSTFLVSLSYHLGCNPIVLVGVDLAQDGKKSYAGNLERSEEGELIALPNGLYTRRDWMFAAQWLGDFAKKHGDHTSWINASRGIEIKGFEARALKEIVFESEGDLANRIHREIEGIEMGVFPGVDSKEMQKSFAKVEALCEEMLRLLEKLFPEHPQKSGEYTLLEVEIEQELAFEKFLRPIWNIWKHVFIRQLPKDIPDAYGIGLNQWLFIKGMCRDAGKV